MRDDSDSGGRERVSEAGGETRGRPSSVPGVSGADADTAEAPGDRDANTELPVGTAGLRSETAACVPGAGGEAAAADLETGALIDSRLCWSVILKRFSWTSGMVESGAPLGESAASPFTKAALLEAIFDKAPLMAFQSPSIQGSTTTSSLERTKPSK